MERAIQKSPRWTRANVSDAVLAVFVVLVVGMMIVPLPTHLLDILIATNITIAVLILLVSFYAKEAMAFASFPTVLLVTTLYRLALNVSSTRLVLLQADAGDVIYAFGSFVVRGNYVVGAVVFLILTLIQFIVVAKGSERVAEVGARFTLDAMPGKQMSIDAELRSGALSPDESRAKRRLLERESQFYGAMDGAMKFVKGDAIAGIVITVVNIVGGLVIGVVLRDLSIEQSLRTYGLLTIGDGIVSQIPALLISTAAGLVVTRVASVDGQGSLGAEIGEQVFGHARALMICAAFACILALVPGFPAFPFLLLAGALAALGRFQSRRASRHAAHSTLTRFDSESLPTTFAEPLCIELGVDLALVLREGNAFDRELGRQRDRLQEELGVLLPVALVRTNVTLPSSGYRILLEGVPWRPTAPGTVVGNVDDFSTVDDLSAAPESVAQKVAVAVRERAHELLGIEETQHLIDQLEHTRPALVRQVTPKPISLPLLTEVLQRLLEEGVSIRPLREILEALARVPGDERLDAATLTERVRVALRRHLSYRAAKDSVLSVYLLDPEIEEAIREASQRSRHASVFAMAPDLVRTIVEAVQKELQAHATTARSTVIVTQPDVRPHVRSLLSRDIRHATVLSYRELDPELEVRPIAHIGIGGPRP